MGYIWMGTIVKRASGIMILIQDELERVSRNIQKQLSMDNLKFQYSTMNEFITEMSKIKNENKKFPFFFVHSLGVSYDNSNNDIICTVKDIIIAVDSNSNWTSDIRDQKTIKPILLPIYDTFLDKLTRDRGIEIQSKGKVIVHYFYGNTGFAGYDGEIYPDHLDAIQLTDFKFRIINRNCLNK